MTHLGEGAECLIKNQLSLFGIHKFRQSSETFLGLIWNVLEKLEWKRKEEQAMVKAALG